VRDAAVAFSSVNLLLAAAVTPDPPLALLLRIITLLACIACGPLTFAKMWEPQ